MELIKLTYNGRYVIIGYKEFLRKVKEHGAIYFPKLGGILGPGYWIDIQMETVNTKHPMEDI